MIVITGASATGKTETARVIKTLYGIQKVVTHTTRPMRLGEIADVDYHYVTKEEFLKLKADNKFVETTEYNGNYYGTSKAEVAPNKIVIVETSGAKVFLNLNDPSIVVFRLLASRKLRHSRMLERGDSLVAIQSRLTNDVTCFDDSALKNPRIIDIQTASMTIEEVARTIYEKYQKEIINISVTK
jgi:guanylate kinase